ncbi:MAG: DUF982 domain-containing protein [Mesorhizobium sp.]|nr:MULTISPECIES: DUF982 domain-containing protein [unclassified Mesorhizobium]RUW17697.1 DUF982 domain-containing protein [Mesorhizobium sp. M1E.F.Ca.ET.041.01.1.1]RUW72133.1 DUF982 domain-containing protein [Mesorhizobium sp. M1E.F.Ca.ET.063.01.1.1]RWD87055.1 MAG: DUF982 domain-containing protein [Mesorhizobium sp.]
MDAEDFGSPIFVKRAAYIVQEIASLADAIDFLSDWPEDQRDLIHQTALQACYDAEDGHKQLSAAHHAFIDFARQVAILEDPISAMQWIAACKSGARRDRLGCS